MSALVLVVDHDSDTCDMLREFLILEGFAVGCVQDAELAWTAIQRRRPDAVVLEVSAVLGSHEALLDRIIGLDPPMPVVLTSLDAPPPVCRGYRTLTKPFDLDDLLDALSASIGSERIALSG